MKVQLPVDPFHITQKFGSNPAIYAQFGLKGHNGWDLRTKQEDTPLGRRSILSPQDSDFYKKGDEGSKGYGKYFEIITRTDKSIWKHTFAHCHSIQDFKHKKQSEEMAISNNTGFSTAAHLHWTVKRIKINSDGTHTVINYSNGFFGAVNPQEYIDEVRAMSSTPIPPMSTKYEGICDKIKIAVIDKNRHISDITDTEWKKVTDEIASWQERSGFFDKVALALGLNLPATLEAVLNSIGGLKGLSTTVQTQKATIENLNNTISSLRDQLTILAESIRKLESSPNPYKDQAIFWEGQASTYKKERDDLNIALAKCKASNDTARKNLIQRVTDFINSIWK